MRRLRGLTLVVLTAILVSATLAIAAGSATATYVYTVPGSTVPGLSTGLVVAPGAPVTVTATGAVCPYGSGFCPGPDGDTGWNTTGILYGGFPLPGGPAWGLLARVGSGPWVHVGRGPTTVGGTGAREFAVNDDYLSDNTGVFTVTVTVTTSSETGSCKPGWGHGDKNHEHCGPPGLAKKPESGQGTSGGHGKSGDSNGKAVGRSGR